MATILNEYYNQELNFISYVVQNNYGFAVSVKDLDADQYIGNLKLFKSLLDAQAYAIKIAS